MGKQQTKSVTTPYGKVTEGDKYVPADNSNYFITIVDVETFKDVEDIVISCPNGTTRRIDWFKLSYRYLPEHEQEAHKAKCKMVRESALKIAKDRQNE